MPDHYHLGPLFRIINSWFEQNLSAALASTELTGAQGFFLSHLVRRQGQTIHPKDLEQQFELSHATVSGILQRLEAKGFLICQPDPDDRRHKRILLTQKALDCTARIHQSIQSTETQLLQGMRTEEKDQLLRLLTRAAENIADPEAKRILRTHSRCPADGGPTTQQGGCFQ